MKHVMFNVTNGGRPDAPDVGIVITDGDSDGSSLTGSGPGGVREGEEGVTLYWVAAGGAGQTLERELLDLDPGDVFLVNDSPELVRAAAFVQRKVCEGELCWVLLQQIIT